MVKNQKGGSGAKSQASKHSKPAAGAGKVRTSHDACEVYALVTAVLGNRMVHVYCQDTEQRLCHIRGKFAGRGKGDNFLSVGTWCLVGIRDYETVPKGKLQNCDILEVYKDSDKARLIDLDGHPCFTDFLKKDLDSKGGGGGAYTSDLDNILFVAQGNGYAEDLKIMNEEKSDEVRSSVSQINIDDI